MPHQISTPDQKRFELRALEVLAHPRMQAAVAELGPYWLDQVRPAPEMRASFDSKYPEVVYGAIIWSLNTDTERPAVITISRLPHELGGVAIPGSRWGIDNPDSVYRVIPIDGAAKYVIRGRVPDPRLTENYFTLWTDKMATVDVLDGKSLHVDKDGRFEIAVDSGEKGQRPDHVRSSMAAKEFYIRDVVMDWNRERVNELSIERLGDPPQRPERTIDQQVDAAIALLRLNIDNTVRWNRQALDKAANAFDFKIDRDTDGALRNQIYVMGHFRLRDDEALVVDVGLGGADYFLAPITNQWGTTNDIQNRTASLNLNQSVRNADGTLTYVVSRRDPGVHNWLDPCDMPEGILTLRWAEFANGRPGDGFGAKGRVVKLGQLKSELSSGTRWLTASDRAEQLRARAASYAWRIGE
jgi:hypothetical protein